LTINQKKYGQKRRKHYLTRLVDFWLARVMRLVQMRCFRVFLLLLGTKS
jgi:hypothetical protein